MNLTSASTCDEFMSLTQPHLRDLTRTGMRLTRQPAECNDLVQETLLKAWSKRDRFDPRGNLGAWLSRILINTFISNYRHQRVVAAAAARSDLVEHLFDRQRLADADDPAECWHRSELADEVLQALRALPPAFREIVELIDLHGLAYRDAADRLGIPVGTVMSRLHRARRLLRDQLRLYAREHGLGLAA
ncbi:MAG: sigma-70 family RNA polymerase sigma factor [Nannocystis sp.]|nr:sigma-70 family RNA polymerase sigma factor [Nannocystis sp.]